jgi:hypothetical protein
VNNRDIISILFIALGNQSYIIVATKKGGKNGEVG